MTQPDLSAITTAALFEFETGDRILSDSSWTYGRRSGWREDQHGEPSNPFKSQPMHQVARPVDEHQTDVFLVQQQSRDVFYGIALQADTAGHLRMRRVILEHGAPFSLEPGDVIIERSNTFQYGGPDGEPGWIVDEQEFVDLDHPFVDGKSQVLLRQSEHDPIEIYRIAATTALEMRALPVDLARTQESAGRFHSVNVRERVTELLEDWPGRDDVGRMGVGLVQGHASGPYYMSTSAHQLVDAAGRAASAQFETGVRLLNHVRSELSAVFRTRHESYPLPRGDATLPKLAGRQLDQALDETVPGWIGLWRGQAEEFRALTDSASPEEVRVLRETADNIEFAAGQVAGMLETIDPLARGAFPANHRSDPRIS